MIETARILTGKRELPAFLERAVGRLGKSSTDCLETLAAIAECAVPELGDYCVVELLRGGTTSQAVAAAHVDPAKNGILQESLRYPENDPHHRALILSLRPAAKIVVPFATDERSFGTITLAFCEGRRPTKDAFAMAQRYSALAARFFDIATELAAREEKIHANEEAFSMLCDAVREANDRKRVEAGLRFLAETGAALAESLDLQTIVSTAARRAVPTLADGCAIDLVSESGTRRMAAAHVDEARERAMRAENPSLANRAGVQGYAVVPIKRQDQVIGSITFGWADRAREFERSDLAVAEGLAHHISLAIANARRFQEAQDAVCAREELLATVSHDLKSPLVVVSMQAGLIKKRAHAHPDAQRIQSQAESIERAAGQMNGLVRNLLDLSRIEEGGLGLDVRRHDLTRLTREAISLLLPLARQKHVRIVRTRRPLRENVFAMCDRDRVLQVLANLLGNAIKFSPSRGKIVVGTERAGGVIRVWIADEGPGISAKNQCYLFSRFWRASRADTRGTGLGLSIAKGIVEAHGCRIWVESRSGEGSTFHFTLAGAPGD